jgi:hypothetical protein
LCSILLLLGDVELAFFYYASSVLAGISPFQKEQFGVVTVILQSPLWKLPVDGQLEPKTVTHWIIAELPHSLVNV